MRQFIYFTIIALAFVACGKSENELESAKAELKDLQTQQKDLQKKIDDLNKKIVELDTLAIEPVSRTLVTLTQAKQKEFVYNIQVPGTADSRQNIVVSAESMGNVTRIYVQEGNMVSKGQTIATIDAQVVSTQIAELETRLELALELYEKQERLWKQKIGSEVQYLQAKNNKESLEQSIKSLKAQAAKSRIVAPISGYLEQVMVREGQTVAMGTPAVRIVDLRNIRLTAYVSEKYIGRFSTKDSIEVKFPSINKTIKVKIASIGQIVSNDNRTFTVEAEISNNDNAIKPNVLADVKIPVYKNKEALVVPTSVIQQGKDNDFVYLAVTENDGLVAKKQVVKVGESYSGQTEIMEGIAATDQIIDLGGRNVTDLEPIRIEQ